LQQAFYGIVRTVHTLIIVMITIIILRCTMSSAVIIRCFTPFTPPVARHNRACSPRSSILDPGQISQLFAHSLSPMFVIPPTLLIIQILCTLHAKAYQ
jgi:hypothetical protein